MPGWGSGLRRAAFGLTFATTGCLGPAQSIGAVEQTDGNAGSGGGAATGPSTTSASTGGSPEGSSGGDDSCIPACVGTDPCQQARCRDGQCILIFRDERCELGQFCTPEGCIGEPLQCGESEDILLCESFEDGYAPQWDAGALERIDTMANSGTFSARIALEPDARDQMRFVVDPPLADGILALRAFVRLPSAEAIEQWSILFEITGSSDAGTVRSSLDLRNDAGLLFVTFLSENANLFGLDLLTPGAWSCVELRIDLSDTDGAVELRVDDVSVLTNGPGIDTVPNDGVARIGVGGISSAEHRGPTEYAIDDVVIARAPIGCAVP
ncbi:MAG: hypothetical protein AAGA54_24985 [Myxococcota bacterium]